RTKCADACLRVTRPKRRREPGTRDWYWPAISNCGLARYQLLGLRSRQRRDGRREFAVMQQVDSFVNPHSCDVAGRSSNKRWVSSIYFVNAAGLRPQDSAFVCLSNFPSFDRNHADEELGKLRFGFFEHRGTHHIDTQSLRKLNCGSPNKSFQRARDGCTRDTGEDWFFIENARNQSA